MTKQELYIKSWELAVQMETADVVHPHWYGQTTNSTQRLERWQVYFYEKLQKKQP